MMSPWRAVWVAAFILLLGLIAQSQVSQSRTPVVATTAAVGNRAAADLPDFESAPYPQVAAAVRRLDYHDAKRILLPQLAASANAELALGLIAHQLGETEDAELYLSRADGRTRLLEDWRLLALTEAAIENGNLAAARTAAERLRDRHPYSVLHPRAQLKAIEIAYEEGQVERAMQSVETARTAALPRDLLEQLEILAWQMADETGDRERLRESARQLLTRFPFEASERRSVELFRRTDGTVPWSDFLSTDQLIERSRQLLAVELIDSALSTLNEVPADQRSTEWSLLLADARLAKQQGVAALAALDGIESDDPGERTEIEWRGAKAALEAARVRRNRKNLDSAVRAQYRQDAIARLRTVATDRSDPTRTEAALELLFAQLSNGDNEQYTSALKVLRQLRDVAPRNRAGALFLWKKGWSEFKQRNYTGAIGYWTELREIYPENSYSRSGLYWTGRAQELIGEPDRAEQTLRTVAAISTNDLYRRYANLRLEPPEPPPPPVAREPWPIDLLLHRARVLSNLGLDELALTELEELQGTVDERAYNALKGTVLTRQGNRRKSITHFYRAFRTLGSAEQSSAPLEAWRGYYPLDHADVVSHRAQKQDLSPYTVLAIIRQESAFDTRATSHAGARGLMQVMPATGKELARKLRLRYSTERLYDPSFSVELGTSYFRQVLNMFDGRVELALAGYNSGPYRIKRLWNEAGEDRELDYFIENLSSETPKTYVKRILLFADSYEQLYPELN